MPRRPRRETVLDHLPHHVIVRGNNRRNLFSYPSCYRSFLSLLGFASGRFGVPVHGLVLMRNHVHLVVTPRDVEQLSRWAKNFAQRYALRRNRAREGTGKVFEQRYTAIPIRSARQLAATLPYVELNPVRAGIVDAAERWLWSSYRLHADLADAAPEVANLWTPHPWWCELAASAAERGAIYRDLARRRLEAHRETFVPPPPRPYELVNERPDRTRVAEAVCDELRILPPVASDYLDLGPLGVTPRIVSRK